MKLYFDLVELKEKYCILFLQLKQQLNQLVKIFSYCNKIITFVSSSFTLSTHRLRN